MTKKDFSQRWIKNILTIIDDQLDERTKARLMESCGRACARSEVIDSARTCAGDLDNFLKTLWGWVGPEWLRC